MPKVNKNVKDGEYIKKKAKKYGNSSHIILPKKWEGKLVLVIRL